MQMSLCIRPTVDNTVESVSISTWFVEILYKDSLLTAILAAGIPAILALTLNRRFVKGKMHPARLFIKIFYAGMHRARPQGPFTLAVALLTFLYFFWHFFCDLVRSLRRLLHLSALLTGIDPQPEKGLA
jgi:hypothetical protein